MTSINLFLAKLRKDQDADMPRLLTFSDFASVANPSIHKSYVGYTWRNGYVFKENQDLKLEPSQSAKRSSLQTASTEDRETPRRADDQAMY
jgi:hypothetical protein